MKRLILCLILSALSLQSQSISIFDIDTTNFPTMRAKFYAFDASGNQTRPSESELTLSEDGVQRTITNVSCPNLRYTLSACIMVDTYSYIDLARKGAERFVSFLQMPPDEVGITYMAGAPLIHRDFTRDRVKAVNATTTIPSAPGVDIQRMFYAGKTGGVPFIIPRKNDRKALILITDLHCPNLNLDEARLYADAKANGIRVFTVILNRSDYTGIFKRVANETNGIVFENVRSESQFYNVLEEIARKLTIEPCTIEWQSDYICKLSNYIDAELSYQSAKDKENYFILNERKAELKFIPNTLRFENPIINTKISQEITITAKNKDFNISDIILSNPLYEVTPKSLVIPANQSKKLTISYTATDSAYTYCRFEIISDLCNKLFFANSGWKGVRPKIKSLKLTHPNGRESFIAGSDTIITWEGIPATDTVSLDYSIDSGKTWKNITEEATSLKYEWKNIPLPASSKCLVRISQNEEAKSDKNELSIIWQKNYGGSSKDISNSIIETQDGNLVVAGYSGSSDNDLTNNKGGADYWILKINSKDGNIIWQKNYGGNSEDRAYSIIETQDGNLVLAGFSRSSNGDLTNNKGEADYWVLKLNSDDGNIIWQKNYGGSNDDYGTSIIETQDGNLIVSGSSYSNNSDLTNNKGEADYWILKINSKDGNIIWQKNYGGSNDDYAKSIVGTKDGNLVVAGYSNSKDSDITEYKGYDDYWVLKINSQNGYIIWQKNYGGSSKDIANSIIETQDGNLVVAGQSVSSDSDLTNNNGYFDYWLLKLNSQNGNIIWQKNYGGSGLDYANSIIETKDRNLIVAGYSWSSDGDLTSNNGGSDYWILKLDSQNGNIIWQNNYGGDNYDLAASTIETQDGNLVVAGYSGSNNGDLTNNKDQEDYWILKFSDLLPLQSDTSDTLFSIIAPDLALKVDDIDMGRMLVGSSVDKTETEVICNNGTAPLHVLGLDVTNGNTSEFAVPRGAGDFFLAPGECQTITFQFSPTQVGQRNAKLTVRSTIGNKVDSINIRGEGVQPNVILNTQIVDMGDVLVNTEKDSIVLAVKNTGSAPIKVKPVQYLENNDLFAFDGKDVEFDLAANNSKSLTLYFKPKEQGSVTGRIGFEYNGVGSPLVMLLFGTGIDNRTTPSASISIGSYSAEAGGKISTNLVLDYEYNLTNVTTLSLDLEYNRTLLRPIGNYNPINNGDKASINVNIPYNKQKAGETLTTIDFEVALGNAQGCELTLSNPISNDNNAVIYAKSGSFTLLGICEDGGARLINPELQAGIMSISPNPTNDNFNVEVSLIEAAPSELILLNSLGQQVMTILSTTDTGKHTKSVNTDQLSTGIYYLQLRTATYIENKVIRVEK